MAIVTWTPYDPKAKDANPLPPITGEYGTMSGVGRWSELVWVFDAFYEGVTLACWTQNGDDITTGWWHGIGPNKDDIGVTHWAPLDRPDAPEGT